RAERVAQVVSQDGQEALLELLRAGLLREGRRLGRQRALGRLGRAALGEVPRDLGEGDELALGVAERGDGDAGPETRAVLADAPAFFLEASFARCYFQLALGLRGGDVLGGVQDREVLADDLVGSVSIDT